MAKFLLAAVFLATISTSSSAKYSVLPGSAVDQGFVEMRRSAEQGTTVSKGELEVRMECVGLSYAAALQDVTKEVAPDNGSGTVHIVMFVSLGGDGGSLLSGALEVAREQYREKKKTITFTVYYVLNYQLDQPTQGDEFLLCARLLNKLRIMGVTVFRYTTEQEGIVHDNKYLATNIAEGQLNEAKIIVDGLQSPDATQGNTGGVAAAACNAMFNAILRFRGAGKSVKRVIVTNVPTGMDAETGNWLNKDRMFEFDIIFSIAWNRPCVNITYFTDVQPYVLFFKPPTGKSFFEALDNMITLRRVAVTVQDKSLLQNLKLKETAGQKFVKFDKGTGKLE